MYKNTLVSLSLLIASIGTATAQTPSTQLFKTVTATAVEANASVFQVNVPSSGTVTVAIQGNDKFASASENHHHFSVKLEGKTAYISVPAGTGEYSAGLGTVCGTSISVVITTYEPSKKAADTIFLPKVVIEAPKVCNL